jgi:2-phospho-L-lactate guanylyltransferase
MTPEKLHVVLTMRGIRDSKQRLESALSAAERAELNHRLLMRTLGVVSRWLGDPQACLFVSACGEALSIAAHAGARVLDRPARGHNDAAAAGMSDAAARGARGVMFLPCDLPLLSASALDAFSALFDLRNLVLAPDRHGTGTNALIVDAAAGIEFKFGDGSRALYEAWARGAGLAVSFCTRAELGFDLDTPADLHEWRDKHHGTISEPAHAGPQQRGGWK